MPPFLIPGLEVLEEIGRGSHSVVYRARRNGEDIALKVQKSTDKEESIRLRREALALARVKHPGLAAIRNVGEVDGRVYIALDYVQGQPLSALLEKGPLAERAAVALALDVARALTAIHARGLVHRDLKPANILIDVQGRARLIDLGFAAAQDKGVAGGFVGTWHYAAPEQAGLLNRPVDGRADLYSLGAVLFEMVTGRLPFPTDNIAELIEIHAGGRVPEPRDVNPDIGEHLCLVIRRLLAKDPDDRYQFSEALGRDLERLSAGSEESDFTPSTHGGWRTTSVESPLVGRDKEFGLLQRRWNELMGAGGRAVMISGPAGSGKTRLVRELFGTPLRDRELVLFGACAAADPVPLAPIRQALDEWIRRTEHWSPVRRDRVENIIRHAARDGAPVLRNLSPRLARVLAGPARAGPSVSDQFFDMVADFLLRLARAFERTALVLEDVHWVDEATQQVLVRLAARLSSAPLMLTATCRDTEKPMVCGEILRTAGADLIPMEKFDQERVARLIQAILGGDEVDSAVVAFLWQRCEGNPFVLREHLQALLDSGVLHLNWGRWVLEATSVERLRLPENILDLVLERIADLGANTHSVLAAAAVAGPRFLVDLLSEVSRLEPPVVNAALEEGRRAHLVEPADGGDWVFVHDRVREAALSRITESRRQAYHRRLAQALASGPEDNRVIYAVAEHMFLGVDQPKRVYETNRRAAEMAAGEYAFDRAAVFYFRCREISQAHTMPLDAVFYRGYAETLAALGRVQEAVEGFEEALSYDPAPVERARILYGSAKIHLGRLDTGAAREALTRGFEVLGRRAPGRGTAQFLISLFRGFWGLAFWKPWPKDAESKARLKVLAQLYQQLSVTAYFEIDRKAMVMVLWESWAPVHRHGPSPELVALYGNLTAVTAMLRLRRASRFFGSRAQRVAARIQDPVAAARASVYGGHALHFMGETLEAERSIALCLSENGHLLENWDFLTGCADNTWNLLMRGYAVEAWSWVEKGLERASRAGRQSLVAQGHTYRCYAGPALAALGRPAEGVAHLNEFEKVIASTLQDRWRWGQYLAHRALFLTEQGETGDALRLVRERHAALRLAPKDTPLQLKHYYVAQVYAFALQAEKAAPEMLSEILPLLRAALSALRKSSVHPTLRAHYWVGAAKERRLRRRFSSALRALTRAERLAEETDNPWVLFEVFAERARLLKNEGRQDSAQREALRALHMALDHSWVRRARSLETEFGLEGRSPLAGSSSASPRSRPSQEVASTVILRRHLDALLDVTLASMTRRDPDEQARGVLDEIVRILGAERAYLFLSPDDGQNLFFKSGRDQGRRDLPDDGTYSQTALNHVRVRRAPVVLSGVEGDSEVDAAASVVMRGLRSLVSAPVIFHGRLMGVIYADSRLARGLFNKEDLGIMMALANHIAVALDIARAHRLEVQLQAEQAQGRLAEAVRRLSADLNSTLELPEVLGRLLENIVRFVPFERALVLLEEKGGLQAVASRGYEGGKIPKDALPLAAHPVLADVLREGRFRRAGADGEETVTHCLDLAPVRGWLAVPLVHREKAMGVLVLDRLSGRPFDDKDTDMAMTFAGPAATAIENARLFSEVQKKAVTDSLTGLNNRHHFFYLAEQELKRSQRYNRPFSAIMADIDHFKSFNDRYGHQVGDDVLVGVVERIRASVRSVDIVGRYGGEEFAIFLPETGREEALIVAERVRAAVGGSPLAVRTGRMEATLSLGVAGGDLRKSLTDILKEADEALYEAKRGGRNRVTVSQAK